MFCEDCGYELGTLDKCPICGWSPNNPKVNIVPTNQYNQIPQKKKKKVLPALLISLAAVALIVGIVFIIKSNQVRDLTKPSTEETTSNNTSSEEPTSEDITTSEPTTEADPSIVVEAGSKTIMMYVVGSDLESENACASEDIQEILDSDMNCENINLLIYTGGSFDWDMSEIPDDENATFIIEDGELVQLESDTAKNMGEASTLTEFLQYGYDNYPAEQYSVILWNHGGGSFSGYGYDEVNDDCLTLDELATAFSQSPFGSETKLEWIGFDACLMATVETAAMLSPYANYLVSSQEPEPGWGWDYVFLGEIDQLSTGQEIGTVIADSYITTCEDNFALSPFSYCNVTLSVLDLNKIEPVEEALNSLFALANEDLSAETYATFSKIRSSTKEIATIYTGESSYDVVDMVDLSKKMASQYPTEAAALEAALDDFVVYNTTNEKNANGVSIYYPYNAKEYAVYCSPMYSSFDFASDYASYISSFTTLLTDTETVNVEWTPDTMIPYIGEDYSFCLDLTPEQALNCQNAYFVISRADMENPTNQCFVYMSNHTSLNSEGTLTADYDGEVIYIQNDTTLDQYEVMYTELESTDEYTRYLLSSILFNETIEDEDAMYAYFVMEVTEENPSGTILGAYPIANLIGGENTDLFPERFEININDYSNIAFGSFSHEFTTTEDLNVFNESDWSDIVLSYNFFPVTDGFSTVLGGMIPDVPYYGMFVIEDIQGVRHCSNLVQIQ